MKFLITERLSEHRSKTPEGYLICLDAILARTGKQTYRKNEIFADSNDDSEIEVDRTEDEVFSPATLASFENKPITVEHPDEDVNVHNYKEYAVGFVRDVRKGSIDGKPVMLGNLVITDEETIKEIENGKHTELSCGYDCDIEDEEHPCQKNIRGNHVALCEQGRAGIARIVDSVKDISSLDFHYLLEQLDDHRINYDDASEETHLIWVKSQANYNKIKEFLDRRRYQYREGINKRGTKYFEIRDSVKDISSLVGKKVKIKSPDSWANGEWGIVFSEDGDDVFVGIAGDKNSQLIFSKNEVKVMDSVEDARSFKIPAGTTIKMINRAPYNSNAKLIEGTKAITTNKDIVASDIASLRKQCEQLFVKAYNSYQGTDWGWSDDFNIKQFVQDATYQDYYNKFEKETNKEFLKEALNEMRRYERNWSFMSTQEKRNIAPNGGIKELRENIAFAEKRLRELHDSIDDAIYSVETSNASTSLDKTFNTFEEAKNYCKTIYKKGGNRTEIWKENMLIAYISEQGTWWINPQYHYKDCVDDAEKLTVTELLNAPIGTKVLHNNRKFVKTSIGRDLNWKEENSDNKYSEYALAQTNGGCVKMYDAIKKYAEDKLGRQFVLEEQSDGSIKATNESGRVKTFRNWKEAREEFSKRSITIFDDDKLDKATEQAYRALKFGAINSEEVIQELKRTFGLSYDDAKRAFMKAHMKYEFEDSIKDVEPRADESKDEFIARFMKETEGEYPDEKQRLAVAYSYWNKKNSVKDKLVDPPQDIINNFERQLKANGVIITATGKTMILGRNHYQVKYYGSGRELNDIFKRIDQYMRSKNIPMTWSIASDTENDICTAGIDLDKMYVKDSSKKMEKVQKIVKAIKKIK